MKPNGKRPRRLPEILTEDEQARLLAGLSSNDPASTRGRAILRTFLDCGLRASELINLQVKNVDFMAGRMKVRGKGDRDRVLWFSGCTQAALEAWLEVKPPSSSPLVFTSLDGKRPVNGRVMRRWIKALGVKAGIENLHPHTCRHSFATDMLKAGVNLPTIQKMLGHSNIGTTMIYLSIHDSDVELAMKGFRREG